MIKENKNLDKICFFLSSFRAGGGEKNMITLAHLFVENGYVVEIVVLKPVGQYKDEINERIKVINIDAGRILFSLPKLIGYINTSRPDFLFATDEFTHILALIAKAISKSKVRVVLRFGNMFSILFKKYDNFKRGKIIPFIAKKIYKYADIFIANSFGVADDASRYFNIPKDNIHVIYNPKDVSGIIKRSSEETGVKEIDNETIPKILFFGRLREQKGIDISLKAFAELVKEVPAKLVIVGVGREQGRLETLTKELEISDQVIFYGYSSNPYAFVPKSDIFLSNSRWEGFSNSLQEALVCGIPVVASDCSSGPREMLAPDTNPLFRLQKGVEYAEYGILVPVDGIAETTTAMKKLLTDMELNKKYREISKKRGKDFDSISIFEGYKNALK